MSLFSMEFFASFTSVRLSTAFLMAPSTSTLIAVNGICSPGSSEVVQKSGEAGSRMSARRRSSACVIAASATITVSSLRATSACASTMSIGAMVPIWTRFSLSAMARLARSSDCCCAERFSRAKARSQ